MKTAVTFVTIAGFLALAAPLHADDSLPMHHAAAIKGEADFVEHSCPGWHVVSQGRLRAAIIDTGVQIMGHEAEIATRAARIEDALHDGGDDASVCSGIAGELGPSGTMAPNVIDRD